MKVKIIILLFVALILSGCRYGRGIRGNGHVVQKEINVSEFNKIEMGGIYAVDISIGEPQIVKIKAEENLIKYLKVDVHNRQLILSSKRNISPRKGIKVKVVVKSLEEIQTSGASFADASMIDADHFNLEIRGASKVELDGKANNLSLSVTGAGKLYAKNFECEKVSANISGAANAIVNVSKKLIADISGAGSLKYYGNPEDLDYNTSGMGSIKKK